MDQDLQIAVTAAIKVAYGILSEKWLTTLALIFTGVFFGWAMYEPTDIHLKIAGAFAGLVFLPVLLGGLLRSHYEAARPEA